MSGLTTHLARRGFEAAVNVHKSVKDGEQPDGSFQLHLPAWGIALLVLTGVAFMFAMFAVKYSYGGVVAALTIVEAPQPDVYVAVNTIDNQDSANKQPNHTDPLVDDPETIQVKTKPITSSIRSTILHLRARAGYWSRFRGLGLFVAWSFVRSFIVGILGGASSVLRHPLYNAVVAIVVETLLANWEMAWYHIVISEPSPKKWWQRVPSIRGHWVKMAPAVALRATAAQVGLIFPLLLGTSFGILREINSPQPEKGDVVSNPWTILVSSLVIMFTAAALFVLIEIPATVTAVRVAASMLPEEDETIVPFDRSFGGKTTPAIVGGQGKVGIVEAWRSFEWPSRIRLLKLVAKITAILAATWVAFSLLSVAELRVVLGKDWDKLMANAKAHMGH